jgi:hypothetical protein
MLVFFSLSIYLQQWEKASTRWEVGLLCVPCNCGRCKKRSIVYIFLNLRKMGTNNNVLLYMYGLPE